MKYENMADILTEKQSGNYALKKFTIDCNNFRAIMSGIPCGEYISLRGPDNDGDGMNTLLMSNTPMEKRTNSNFVLKANGDVLIAGLGLGLIILPIQNKPEVTSITVIEKSKEVIEIVGSQLPLNNKVKIINDDIFKYAPECKYDTIYLDIWPYVNEDVYEEEMKPLKQKYRKYLVSKNKNPNRFLKCWAELEARYGKPLY